MKAKRVLTIGLLTITAIGLVGCAIVLGKKNDAFKPKVMQTNAYYEVDSYSYTNNTWYITGSTNQNPYLNENNEINTTTICNYVLNKTSQTNIYITLQPKTILTIYGDEQQLNNINIGTYFTLNQDKTLKRITIIQEYIVEGETDEHGNPLNWEFSYDFKLQYTDNTITTKSSYFILATENINIDIIWTEIPNELEIVEINNTIATLSNTYQTGYTTGYQTKGDLADGNFIDIRNMMLSVLTMPFTFINQAFNVTLWEGTAYEFNIGNFIKGIIAIATILFIIRVFTSGFSIIGNYTNDARAKKDTSNLRRSQTELNKAKTRRESKLADKGK